MEKWFLQPKFLFCVVCFINLMNFIDRGVIPGATNEFNTFIDNDLNTNTPDVYLGLLQSSFIIGFMAGSVIFGHMVHHYGRFFLISIGVSTWMVAVTLCGFSYYTGSYTFLLFCRILSGVGEASLQCTVPPWIQSVAPRDHTGSWLAIFFTAIPVGTALGFAYSSVVASLLGWQWAFFFEAIVMFPVVLFLCRISPLFPCESPVGKRKDSDEPFVQHERPTMATELWAVSSCTLFLCVSFAYAAQSATLTGLSTFGSSFLMGLGFFDDEAQASTIFGVVISVTGMISTPLGGVLLDRLLRAEKVRGTEREEVGLSNAEQKPAEEERNEEILEYDNVAGSGDPGAENRREELTPPEVRRQMHLLSLFGAAFSFLALLLLCLSYFAYNSALFIVLTALGCGLLFSTYSAFNLAVLLSVPLPHRSFSVALNSVFLHTFGDVPSPVIVGFLKDSLAPGCTADSSSDDDEVASSAECRDDAQGLRMCILLTDLWLMWTVVFFLATYQLNKHNLLQVGDLRTCGKESNELYDPLLQTEQKDGSDCDRKEIKSIVNADS